MYAGPRGSREGEPIGECAGSLSPQQHCTYGYPMDTRGLEPIEARANGHCVQHLSMCANPNEPRALVEGGERRPARVLRRIGTHPCIVHLCIVHT